MAPDSSAQGTAPTGNDMSTTETTIAPAAARAVPLPGLRRLSAAVLATILAIWAASAPGFPEWETQFATSTRLAGLTAPMACILLLALLPAWLSFERVLTAGLQFFARIGVGSEVRTRPGSTSGLWLGHFRWVAPVRDAAFRVHGCLAGAALGIVVTGSTQALLAAWLFGTRFESGATVLGALLGMLSGACVMLALVSVPRRAATWRIEGPVEGAAAMEVLRYGADLLFLSLVIYLTGYAIDWKAAPSLLVLPLVTLGALTGYALPRLLWRERSGTPRGVWVVLLYHGDAGPKDVERALRQVDVLAHTWVHGPVTVVSNASLAMGGEQLHAALALGRERSMFPRIEVELADWGMLLPPRERWRASPVRELHVPAHLMRPALERFAGAADLVVLVSGQLEPIHAWRQRLRYAETVVAWDGDGTGPAGAIALDSLGEHLGRRSAGSSAATLAPAPPREADKPGPAPADTAVAKAADELVKHAASAPETGPGPMDETMDKTAEQEAAIDHDPAIRRLFETCILVGNESMSQGTGFVVARGFAATADHVLGDLTIGENVSVSVGRLGAHRVSATIHRRDPVNDLALLRLQDYDDIAPLPLRTDAAAGDTWMACGFHWPEHANEPVGKTLAGTILRSDALSPDGAPYIELACTEHLPPGDPRGMSGSPVIVGGKLAAMLVATMGSADDKSSSHIIASPIGGLIALLPPRPSNSQSAPAD
jgi:hypothetical protein